MNTERSDINLNIFENTNTSTDLRSLRSNKAKVFLVQKREFHNNRIKAGERIGPRNLDIFSVIIGSLLGNHGNKRSAEGTRICYR